MNRSSVTFFNLWALVLCLVGLNPAQQGYLDSLTHKSLAQSEDIEYNHSAPLDENHYASQLDGLGIDLTSNTGGTSSLQEGESSLNHCKSVVYKTLASLPQDQVQSLHHLTLTFEQGGRRGMGGGSTIILHCNVSGDEELASVLVHEMGHIVHSSLRQVSIDKGIIPNDLFVLNSEFKDSNVPLKNDDPVLGFYRLSFLNEKVLRPNASALDFVSGYAMSDPYEDFAETHNFYVLHGDMFRKMMTTNTILQKKYDFLKTWVFHGKEFTNSDSSRQVSYVSRDYDTTVLHYDMKKFFVSVQ